MGAAVPGARRAVRGVRDAVRPEPDGLRARRRPLHRDGVPRPGPLLGRRVLPADRGHRPGPGGRGRRRAVRPRVRRLRPASRRGPHVRHRGRGAVRPVPAVAAQHDLPLVRARAHAPGPRLPGLRHQGRARRDLRGAAHAQAADRLLRPVGAVARRRGRRRAGAARGGGPVRGAVPLAGRGGGAGRVHRPPAGTRRGRGQPQRRRDPQDLGERAAAADLPLRARRRRPPDADLAGRARRRVAVLGAHPPAALRRARLRPGRVRPPRAPDEAGGELAAQALQAQGRRGLGRLLPRGRLPRRRRPGLPARPRQRPAGRAAGARGPGHAAAPRRVPGRRARWSTR